MTPPAQDVTVFYRTAVDSNDTIELVVTLPTFRRPEHLLKTLKTVISQAPGCPFAIVVMENDADGLEGAKAAKMFFADHRVNALVVIAHQRGNCHAYNAGWSMALSAYPGLQAIAVIDDDELAAPDWLDNLVSVHRQTRADLIGGPQLPDFEDKARNDRKRHPVFMPHYDATGPVPILYSSGNVLITRHVLDAMPRPFLDPLFNFIGGETATFIAAARKTGFPLPGQRRPGWPKPFRHGARNCPGSGRAACATGRFPPCSSTAQRRALPGGCARLPNRSLSWRPRRFAAFRCGDRPACQRPASTISTWRAGG